MWFRSDVSVEQLKAKTFEIPDYEAYLAAQRLQQSYLMKQINIKVLNYKEISDKANEHKISIDDCPEFRVIL